VKRLASLTAAAVAASVLALSGGASGASPLPTMNVTLTGTTGISVSGSTVSGAVSIVSTHTGAGMGDYALVRANPNVPPAQALAQGFAAVQAAHGDLNALTALGDAIVVDAPAPGTVQAVLTPGTWIALNLTGMGQPSHVVFNVTQASPEATLPAAAATQKAIDFAFRGPTTLHNGTMVRAENGGFLVHMIDLLGVKNKADGRLALAGLKAGKGHKFFRPLSNGVFLTLLGPASPGALQQSVLNTKPGWYVEACFMNVQDGREHTQIGMERLVHIV
jgi:hypothetical protein